MERWPSFKQLKHFAMLAEERHFGQAAERLKITQSTLSASIRELELVLGAPVVDRAGKRVALTPLGEEVLARGEKILLQLDELTRAARASAMPLTGTLRLGVIPTISPFLLPRLLPGLRHRYPLLKLFLREDLTDNLMAQLHRGQLDLLLLALPCACGSEEVHSLARDAFMVVLRKDHALARAKGIKVAELQKEKLLVLQDGHCLREQSLSACRLKAPDDEAYAATSLHTLVQMVDNGLGLALLPEMAVKAGILSGTQLLAKPVLDAPAWRDIAVIWRRGSARAEEFRLLAGELGKLMGRRAS